MADNSTYTFGNCTDTGMVRQANEDYYGNWNLDAGHLFVVCDGMGGHVGGAVASRTAAEAIHQYFTSQPASSNASVGLLRSFELANNAVLEAAKADETLNGMGTTVVAVLVRNNQVYYAHLGDSRIYLLRNGKPERLTKDHSLVQMLLDGGHITPAEAEVHPNKNVIEKALGIETVIAPDICTDPLVPQPGDMLMLCTDGLTGMVAESTISTIMTDNKLTIQEKATELVKLANKAGGTDNITVQLIQFNENKAVVPTKKSRSSLPLIFVAVLVSLLAGAAGFYGYKKGWFGSSNSKAVTDTTLKISHPSETGKKGKNNINLDDTLKTARINNSADGSTNVQAVDSPNNIHDRESDLPTVKPQPADLTDDKKAANNPKNKADDKNKKGKKDTLSNAKKVVKGTKDSVKNVSLPVTDPVDKPKTDSNPKPPKP